MEARRSSLPSAPRVTLYSSSVLSRRTRRLASSIVPAITVVGEGSWHGVWCYRTPLAGEHTVLPAISGHDAGEEMLDNCLATALCLHNQKL